MSYVTENNEVYRNLQEQVLKNANDIEALKQGPFISYSVNTVLDLVTLTTEANYGKYILVGTTTPKHLYVITHRANEGLIADDIGEYPAKGQTGETGATGATGEQGTRGPALWSVGSTKPSPSSPYINDDLILITAGECKGQVYKLSNGKWLPVTSVIGPEGPIGPSVDIEVNPNITGQTVQQMNYLKVNGQYYNTTHLTSEEQQMLTNLLTNAEWDEYGSITFGHDVTADGNVVAHNDVEVGRNICVDDSTKIQDHDGNQILQKIKDNLLPFHTMTYSIGSASMIWNNAYINTVNSSKIHPVSGNFDFGASWGYNFCYGWLLPQSSGNFDLGTDSYKWKSLCVSDGIKIGSTTLTEAQLIALLNLL